MKKPTTTKANKANMALPSRDHTHHSVSVSKISNGFLISKSVDGPNGYKTTQTYSPTKPKVEMTVATPKGRRK